jgi:hypothetical protein
MHCVANALLLNNTILISLFHFAYVCQGCAIQVEKYEREVQDLRRQLDLANEKINELEVSIQYTSIHTLVKMKFDMKVIVN